MRYTASDLLAECERRWPNHGGKEWQVWELDDEIEALPPIGWPIEPEVIADATGISVRLKLCVPDTRSPDNTWGDWIDVDGEGVTLTEACQRAADSAPESVRDDAVRVLLGGAS